MISCQTLLLGQRTEVLLQVVVDRFPPAIGHGGLGHAQSGLLALVPEDF